MSRKFLTNLDLGKNQLLQAAIENLAGAPGSPVKGQLYMNTTDNVLYWYNGSGWVAAQGGAGAVPATTVTASAVGDASVVGVATTYAREDHKHSREAFANPTATTTFGLSAVNGSAATVARSDHTHGTPAHDGAAHATISLSSLAAPTADISWGNFKITNLGAPTSGTDATNKDYVDNLSAGISYKDAVRAATTANITLSAPQTVDGVSVIAGDRVLVKDQSTGTQNGIYLVAAGAWTRTTDADGVGELDGAFVVSMEGTANADKAWICSTNGPITPGTTATTWAYYGAGTAYSAGAGLTLTGSTFDVVALDASIVVAADSIRAGYAGNGSAVTLARSDHNHDATYAKVIAQDCAANVLTTVTHNFNTRDVKVEVYRNSTPWDTVDVDVERSSVNTVEVRFAVAPTAAAFRIVVEGIDG